MFSFIRVVLVMVSLIFTGIEQWERHKIVPEVGSCPDVTTPFILLSIRLFLQLSTFLSTERNPITFSAIPLHLKLCTLCFSMLRSIPVYIEYIRVTNCVCRKESILIYLEILRTKIIYLKVFISASSKYIHTQSQKCHILSQNIMKR